jgi:hypothetical protein
MKVHNLKALTMSEAYDETQCNDEIKDGDILLVQDGVAVLVEAWPVMAVGESTVFHRAAPDFHTQTNNRYLAAFSEANIQEVTA